MRQEHYAEQGSLVINPDFPLSKKVCFYNEAQLKITDVIAIDREEARFLRSQGIKVSRGTVKWRSVIEFPSEKKRADAIVSFVEDNEENIELLKQGGFKKNVWRTFKITPAKKTSK